jgi:hypothetical protein
MAFDSWVSQDRFACDCGIVDLFVNEHRDLFVVDGFSLTHGATL